MLVSETRPPPPLPPPLGGGGQWGLRGGNPGFNEAEAPAIDLREVLQSSAVIPQMLYGDGFAKGPEPKSA